MTRDPLTGFGVLLEPEGRGRLRLCDQAGVAAGMIEAPPGYRLSHLVEESGRLLVVGQGDAAVEGWPDWHFEVDAAQCRLTRVGPAY